MTYDVVSDMEVFQRVVERGSFAGAAEASGLSPSAVSKLITRLEARLGVRLITRTTRRLALTPEGELYHRRTRDILGAIQATEAEIASTKAAPRGLLRVHAFPTFAVEQLSSVLPEFLERYPRVTFEFLVTNRAVDLVADHVDVGLRVGRLEDSTLIATKIADLTTVVCASPKYIARHGRPERPQDLARHACLNLSHVPGATRWSFVTDRGAEHIDVQGPVAADSAHMLLRLATEGLGIIRFGDIIVGKAIDDGLLVPIFEDLQKTADLPMWALTTPGKIAPKVRVLLDFLKQRFGHAPWRRKLDGSVQKRARK